MNVKKEYELLEKLYFERIGGTKEELKACTIIQEELAEIGLESTIESFEVVKNDVSEVLLGHLQQVKVSDKQTVINMFAQQYYGYDGKRYTSYDAFWACLGGIRDSVPKGSKIGFPWQIGCGLGGANWEVIMTMIEEVLAEDFEVYIYILGGAE